MPSLALAYHDVDRLREEASGFVGPGPDRFKLTRTRFAEHLDAVAASGITVALVADGSSRRRLLFLTFDDGGASALGTIAPMLAERAWKGHFFVVTSLIGRPGFLGAEGIRELRAAGHLVGSHSHTHPNLTRLPQAEVSEEWTRSKAILEDLLGERVEAASVPTGFYNESVGRAAVEAGLTRLFTSDPRLEPHPLGDGGLAFGRFAVIGTTPAARVASLCGFSRTALWRESALWRGRRVAKRVLGPVYTSLREPVLARLPRR